MSMASYSLVWCQQMSGPFEPNLILSCNICFGHWVILRALNDIKQFFFFKSSKPRTFLSRLSRNQFTKFWCCKTYFTFNWKSSSTKFSFFEKICRIQDKILKSISQLIFVYHSLQYKLSVTSEAGFHDHSVFTYIY